MQRRPKLRTFFRTSVALFGLLWGSRSSLAAHGDDKIEPLIPPNLSTELLDPVGLSRFHFVTRASFSDGDAVFADDATWTFEARAHVRIIPGLAITAVLPFGLFAPEGPGDTFFFGNFSVGIAGGGTFYFGTRDGATAPMFRLGGALDIYAPTAPEPDANEPELARAEAAVISLRSYEPELYTPTAMSFRARAQAELTYDLFTAQLE